MPKESRIYFFIIVLVTFLISCRGDHYKVNISRIEADIEIKRLEADLFNLNPEEIVQSIPALKQKYQGFLQLFSNVIRTGDINDPSFGDLLLRFCTDKQNNEVFESTMNVYPDLKLIEKDIEEAFRHYLFYFPDRIIPALFTCTSGFNYNIIAGDSVLGISLDMYLGADSEYYPRLGIYSYISERMTSDHVVPDCIYGWGASEWVFSTGVSGPEDTQVKYNEENVLTRIIHFGKLKYFQKCMLPGKDDGIIFGFTPGQMKFCRNNESQMWLYLVEKDLLFNTDQFTIRKLTGEAPFTSYFTNESPGRAAIWIGFRIIELYMMKNPGESLEDLMAETNVQKLLEKAKYNPQ